MTEKPTMSAVERYVRNQAMASLQRVRARAKRNGTSEMTLSEINEIIREVRQERRAREQESASGDR